MFSTKNIFQKNDFPEIILRQKSFYIETNGAVVAFTYVFFFFFLCQDRQCLPLPFDFEILTILRGFIRVAQITVIFLLLFFFSRGQLEHMGINSALQIFIMAR
jgi:hypothetical protein